MARANIGIWTSGFSFCQQPWTMLYNKNCKASKRCSDDVGHAKDPWTGIKATKCPRVQWQERHQLSSRGIGSLTSARCVATKHMLLSSCQMWTSGHYLPRTPTHRFGSSKFLRHFEDIFEVVVHVEHFIQSLKPCHTMLQPLPLIPWQPRRWLVTIHARK